MAFQPFAWFSSVGKALGFGRSAMLWGAIGAALGVIAGVLLDDPGLIEPLGFAGFLAFGALGGLGFFATGRSRRRARDRRACLLDARRSFLQELVSQAEYRQMKKECLDRYPG